MMSLTALFLCMLGIATAAKLPDKFPKCSRTDPNLTSCLTNALQASIPHLVKGVPNLGLIPIDPLRITKLDIKRGDGPVAVDLTFENLDIKSFKSAKVNEVKADVNNYRIDIDVNLPQPLILDGDYEINGKILILPITGKGKAHIELDNVHGVLKLQGKELNKDGQIYMDLVDMRMSFDTTKMRIRLENLFNNDKALGENMNSFLNENWQEILKELQPSIEDALSATFKEIARRLYSRVPYDEIILK